MLKKVLGCSAIVLLAVLIRPGPGRRGRLRPRLPARHRDAVSGCVCRASTECGVCAGLQVRRRRDRDEARRRTVERGREAAPVPHRHPRRAPGRGGHADDRGRPTAGRRWWRLWAKVVDRRITQLETMVTHNRAEGVIFDLDSLETEGQPDRRHGATGASGRRATTRFASPSSIRRDYEPAASSPPTFRSRPRRTASRAAG